MSYHFNKIEQKWQEYWAKNQTFRASNNSSKEKYYVLDMFPYPSGAGLHVGHPLGYIASDIYARYKRHKGFNVLHPQGYDSFGLPAEQYAIQTGQHPALTTEENIKRYREQLDKIGFSFDWSREVRTSDADYYKWTQWIFIQLFESWYDNTLDKARPITELEKIFSAEGNLTVKAACDDDTESFSAEDWNSFTPEEKQKIFLKYRLTYLAETEVNWVPQLGTVLANDEIVNGVSERGGYPVIRKKMTQWSMRISAYAERLRADLDKIDWSESLKESQRNWIGKSVGAMVKFPILSFPEGEGTTGPKYMTGGNNSKLLLERAKEKRANPTEAEKVLWDELKSKALGHKFRQQHLIDDFIVDFVCLSRKLVIEVDGGYHTNQQDKDLLRTKILNEREFHVIRFTNEEVLGNIQDVLEKIKKELEQSIVPPSGARGISVFTTRPDTIFGVTFMTLAPEHELVSQITTPEQKEEVEAYVQASARRSERERMADVKTISGVFTGAYAQHPFTKEPVPIWIGDYVLAGYGTGAVMAVPCGDQRDYDFAKHFNIPIKNIFANVDISEEAFTGKEDAVITDSDFLSGLSYKEALPKAIEELEKIGLGKGKTNYRLRDAVFSRQRYWGEPFPVYYVNGMPQMIDEKYLPLRLPEVEKYLPTEEGEPPLGRAEKWYWDEEKKQVVSKEEFESSPFGRGGSLELNTMPGWAGSSWYFFRYMDANNEERFVSKEAQKYWENVDLYIGGSEHATGHLLYSRFWTKFLYDRKMVTVEEPFKKLINQGMILGQSAFVYRVEGENKLLSKNQVGEKSVQPIHADVSLVNHSDELDIEAFKQWRPEFENAEFVTEKNGAFIVGREVEKMSKSKYNVVNPDEICQQYGADTLRMYEMFLGPLEQAKPWNTAGITGVHSFLKKLWKLYHSGPDGSFYVNDSPPSTGSGEDLKTLHKTIKKVTEDIENFSFNTSVSTFMICVNELSAQKCDKREILEPLVILLAPYAPHIAEELWEKLGHSESVSAAAYPVFQDKFLVESKKEYPISFNGKMRFTLELPLELSPKEIENAVMSDERTLKQLEGRSPKKVIIVPGKIVNIVG